MSVLSEAARTKVRCPNGFSAAGLHCGIKPSGDLDLALIQCENEIPVAAVFTTNRLRAAPIEVSARHLQSSSGLVRALIINSGVANAATGAQGLNDAQQTVSALADALQCPHDRILINSTGVIGQSLPVDRIVEAIPELVSASSTDGLSRAAQAIMTTDTVPKIVDLKIEHEDRTVRIVGIAKGAGMIHPNMATMIAVLMTDASINVSELDSMLRVAVEQSFHRISVDGDTSTNDAVFAMASGRAGGFPSELIQAGISKAARKLAIMIVRDGEGARKLIQVSVTGAHNASDALRVAQTVATSALVRTAVAGGDPNWGRILAAIGRSGVEVDMNRVELRVADAPLFHDGSPVSGNESSQECAFEGPDVELHIDLGAGKATDEFFTCDLTEEYVRINATGKT